MASPIGQRLRQAREDYGMKQVELAKRVGMTKQGLNNIEKGRSQPSAFLIQRIAQVLRVRGDYLLCLTDDKDLPALSCRGVLASLLGEINTPTYAPTLPYTHFLL